MTERNFPIGGPVLEVKNISLSFGGVKAITDTSFNVLEHEIRAIIGPNGAGKSSMLNCINGIYKPQVGSVTYKGEEIQKVTPNIMAQKGISRTFQNLALFKRMSVLDNILVGRKLHTTSNFMEVALQLPKAKREEKVNRDRCEEIVEFLEIEDIKNTPVGKLPYGLQKKVELGRALATDANIILLDEPMAGMNVEEKREKCRFSLGPTPSPESSTATSPWSTPPTTSKTRPSGRLSMTSYTPSFIGGGSPKRASNSPKGRRDGKPWRRMRTLSRMPRHCSCLRTLGCS